MGQMCNRCKQEKDLGEFYLRKDKGYTTRICKSCKGAQQRERKSKITHKHVTEKQCSRCMQTKPVDKFQRLNISLDGYGYYCKQCMSEKYCERRKERGDVMREYSLASYYRHRETILAHQKEYRRRTQEVKRGKHREYYERVKDTDRYKAKVRRSNQTRRGRGRTEQDTLTHEEWQLILKLQDNCCLACGRSFDETAPTADHVVPYSKGGALSFDNVQALCRSCNSSKYNKHIDYRWWVVKEASDGMGIMLTQ